MSAGFTVTPNDAVIGAEISGMDLREPLSAEGRTEIRALLGEHKVLFWRDQELSTEEHVGFVRELGPILEFSSVVDDAPELPGVHKVSGSTVGWHIDASGGVDPPVATVLRAVDVPPTGGDTIWASGVAAYEGLPDELKTRLDGLYVSHGPEPKTERPLVCHPLVRTHPDTGERLLYLNPAEWNFSAVLGLDRAEGDELIAAVTDEYLRPENQVRFQWRPGSVAMWDNRAVVHTGVHDYGDYPRRLVRICLARFDDPSES
jgi:taurine dioxygenase